MLATTFFQVSMRVDKMALVCGVGFNDRTYPTRVNSIRTDQYGVWKALLTRCFDQKYKEKNQSYKDCTISENFLNYSYFYEWYNENIIQCESKPQLDKDLLLKGNKIYSEDLCVFIPTEINNTLIKREADRGSYPIGVSKTRYGFLSQVRVNNKNRHLGIFSNPEDAFIRYKHEKEKIIRSLSDKYRKVIDPRAYEALMNYKVEITD